MSLNELLASVLGAGALASCSTLPATAAEVCPARVQHALRYVDVFDGAPEELATLVPDRAGKTSGYWQLGYVYDAGRFVTVRCKYDDKATVDVTLRERVRRCDYAIDPRAVLSLRCG